MKKRKQESGYQKQKRRGLKFILLTLTPEQKDLLQQAADLDGRKLAAWARFILVRAANSQVGNGDQPSTLE